MMILYLVYKRKGRQSTTLPQTGSSDWTATGLGADNSNFGCAPIFKKHHKRLVVGLDWATGQSLLVPS